MGKKVDRRRFLGGSVVAGVAAAGLCGLEEKILQQALAQGAAGKPAGRKGAAGGEMPTGKLGNLTLSRLISGGNLLSGWCHSRDLIYVSKLAAAYLTEEKQFDTLEILEEKGVNAIAVDQMQVHIVNRYCEERGGKIRKIVSVRQDWGGWGKPNWEELKEEIDGVIDDGADTLYVHGGYSDRLVQADKPANLEIIGKAFEYIRGQKLSAGLGSHALEAPVAFDKAGIAPDYYVKTFHHDQYWSATPKDRRKRFCVDGENHLDHNEFHDNIYCIDPDETIEFMKTKEQPWVAFKVLAAGAIEPESGFRYAFEGGADFLMVGMFDFQVVEDVVTVKRVLAESLDRKRPWRS